MFLKYLIILCVCISSITHAVTITTVSAGNWEDPVVWSNHQVPLSPDSIIVYHYIVINQNLTINSPTVLYIDTLGTICGEYLLETLCGASLINRGHLFLGQIKTRSGLNYYIIKCKNYIILSGCSPNGSGYFNTLPPNGSVSVWPPVLCKSQNTNWEGGTQIGIIELEKNSLKIYPNPITNEPLTIVTLSNTRFKLTDITGNEIWKDVFENKTELHIDHLPNGVYFLELEIDGTKQIKRILKSN